MNAFDRVILSCDPNPKYLDFWPVVARAWQKIFKVPVHLVIVANVKTFDYSPLCKHGIVTPVPPIEGIPIANQAKLARYWLAAALADEKVTLINDVDLLPLSKDYVNELVGKRPEGTLVTVGSELYAGPEAGKFMAGYLTAEATVFRSLVNPERLQWWDWIKSFSGVRHFDSKEDISSTVHSENPDCFSDESLLRYLLWKNPVPVQHRKMPFWPYTEGALCRADWKFDPEKLKAGGYKEAHLLRPYKEHVKAIQPLVDYIESL